MKTFILARSDGEFDSYQETVTAVFLVPNKVSEQSLIKEYNDWAVKNLVAIGKRKKLRPKFTLYEWLSKKYKQLDFIYSVDGLV